MTFFQYVALFLSLPLLMALACIAFLWRELPRYPWWPRIVGAALFAVAAYIGATKLLELSDLVMSHGSESLDPLSAIFLIGMLGGYAFAPAILGTIALLIIKWRMPKDPF